LVQQLATSGQIRETLPIQAPFSGSIVEVSALPGAAVSAGSPIYKIADLSYVDVAAAIPERALPLVRIGLKANVRLASYPGVQFDGVVERMEQQLDEATRTVNAIIHVQNRSGSLMPGMFATVRLQTPGAAATNVSSAIVTIPETAVVNDGEQRFVFVEIKPGTYERRLVEVASLEAPGASQPLTNRIVVRRGLVAGERVVVRGAFTLKSEMGKSAFGDEH
jgi:RND family efflux transporter MFP subunit